MSNSNTPTLIPTYEYLLFRLQENKRMQQVILMLENVSEEEQSRNLELLRLLRKQQKLLEVDLNLLN